MMEQQHKSPFKFLDSYAQGDRDIFFGRDQEIEEIYSKVFQSKLLLVYGASGTGKSSIINCGLANKFEESDWLPIHIRRGGNIRRSMLNQIQKEAVNKLELSDEDQKSNEGLEKALGSVFLDHFKPIYLIFDQFEELFIFGFKDEWKDFISSIRYLMESDLNVRFIFVVRGEYLEFLSEFEDAIPQFFDNRVRVEKMTRKNAEQSISGPTRLFPIDLEEGFEEKLLRKLSPEKSHIELTFLQVFLDKIYKRASEQRDESERIRFSKEEIDRLGQIEDVLAEFVDEQLFNMPDSKAALTVLKSFVSLQGTKTQKSLEEVVQYTRDIGQNISLDSTESIIATFVNKRILKDHDDNGRYELRHDSLAQKIFEKITIQERELLDIKQFLSYSFNEYDKRGILLNDEDLSYIAPHERNLNLEVEVIEFIRISRKNSSKKRKQRKTRTIITMVIVALLLTSVAGLFYSQQQKQRAEELALIATQESSEARLQRENAEAKEAEAARQAEIATLEKRRAESSSQEALRQKDLAERQRIIAEREKELADNARRRSELSEQEANHQRSIADQQRQIAYRLRMLSLSKEMAVKSTHMISPDLKGLLALQAYQFNREYGGKAFQPEIYSALYSARKSLSTELFNGDKTHDQVIKSMISQSSGLFSAGNDGKITRTVWVGNTPRTKLILESDFIIETMDIDPNENFLVIGTHRGALAKISIAGGKLEFEKEAHSSEVSKVFVTTENIISVGQDGLISFFDLDGTQVNTLNLDEIATASMADAILRVALKNGEIHSIDKKGNRVGSFTPMDFQKITAIDVDSMNSLMAVGYGHGEILIWDLKAQNALQVLPGHTAAITDLSFDPDGEFLVSGSFDRSIRLWNLDEMQEPPIVIQDHDSWVSAVTFDQEGLFFYSGVFGGIQRRFSKNSESMTDGLCEIIGRNMTESEWTEFVAEDIDYETTCTNE